ncbi:MAG: methyl-accepting chemotaxis protein [Undibacterium umbellatum]|uniref:methyl-accepting chemotaxis protein n=1 Tax=Undibacterium umbellatum TaxID=2762300 RepID=UPI003BB4F1D1
MKTTLKTRLMLVMGIMSAMIILVGLTGLFAMNALQQSLQASHAEHSPVLDNIARLDKLLLNTRYATLASLADPTIERMHASADELEREKRDIDQFWMEFATHSMSPETRKKTDELTNLRIGFDHAVSLPLIEALRDADTSRIREIKRLAEPLHGPIINAVQGLRTTQLDLAKKEYASAQARYDTANQLILAIIALGLVLAAALAYFLIQVMYRQLGGEPAYAAQIARQIADGDLDVNITADVTEGTSLLASMQQLQRGLTKTVKDMRLDTAHIARTSGLQVNHNAMLSSRIDLQASLHRQITTATKELASAVRHNSEKARQAMQAVDDSSELAIKKMESASGAFETITQIRHASDKIADNIHVIDELAFQIDTLALKATMEDGTASDASQGLAVTAPEIRHLAQCVALASKEIKNLLNESQEKMENGSKLISQGGAGTEHLLTAIQYSHTVMASINASTKEQEASIRQIRHAVSDMDYANRKDAILLGVSTTTSRLMEQQANHLAQLGGGFKLGTMQGPQAKLQVVNAIVAEDMPPKRPNLRLVRP